MRPTRSTRWLLVAGLSLVAGCATLEPAPPSTLNAGQAGHAPPSQPVRGAIWHPQSAALFADQRASRVGDMITVQIVEHTTASNQASTRISRSGQQEADLPLLRGLPGKGLQGLGLGASSHNDFEGDGEAEAAHRFAGSITVTVTEVLPNGNLQVAGEKQLIINHSPERIRLSGLIHPTSILAGNVVPSTRVADARVEFMNRGAIGETQRMGWLSRIFMSVLPF